MTRWRGRWLAAQIAPMVVSASVWIVVIAAWPISAAFAAAVVAAAALMWSSPVGLRWRHGVRPLSEPAAERLWEALAGVRSLRGRSQPRLLVGRWNTHGVVANGRDLIFNGRLAEELARGRVSGDQLVAITLHAVGCEPVTSSRMVAGVSAACWPWHAAMLITTALGGAARRLPLIGLAWNIRWLIFGIAMVQSWQAQRWPALIVVAVLTVLSAIHPWASSRWQARLVQLGDARVIGEGYGPVLAEMIRSAGGQTMAVLERAHRLYATPQ